MSVLFDLHRAEQRLQAQVVLIRQQRRISDIVRNMNPSLPGHLRALARGTGASRDLRSAAQTQAMRIYKKEMSRLNSLPRDQAFEELNKLLQGEWSCLRGNFPSLAYDAQSNLQKFRGSKI